MTAPTLPYRVYAICAGSGPVVIGRYESEQERNRAYRMAQQRLRDGGYSPDVRDIALGEDPEWKKERPAMSLAALEVFGDGSPEARAPPLGDGNSPRRLAGTGPATRTQLAIDFASGDTHS